MIVLVHGTLMLIHPVGGKNRSIHILLVPDRFGHSNISYGLIPKSKNATNGHFIWTVVNNGHVNKTNSHIWRKTLSN